MAYSPTMVANNILARSFEDRRLITPMKLQKILYFVASEYQKATGKPLLEEQFQTWAYGPVLYSVYDEFRPFAKAHIKRYARDAAGHTYALREDDDSALASALDRVWAATKTKSATYLSELTHAEGSAWDAAFQQDRPILDDADIRRDETYREPLKLVS